MAGERVEVTGQVYKVQSPCKGIAVGVTDFIEINFLFLTCTKFHFKQVLHNYALGYNLL